VPRAKPPSPQGEGKRIGYALNGKDGGQGRKCYIR